jgi:gliding motility-associated lipoprotein GldD
MPEKNMRPKYWILLVLNPFFFWACEGNFNPKPKGYNRIDLPRHEYIKSPDSLPYFFEYSTQANLEPHKSPWAEPFWIDLKYYGMGAEIQITYKSITKGEEELISLMNDAYRLTSRHQVKASAIERTQININKTTSATLFRLEGEVPSQFQFIATDSSVNFIRGALYFKTSTKNDSLEPLIEFISRDILHMVQTLKWTDLNS